MSALMQTSLPQRFRSGCPGPQDELVSLPCAGAMHSPHSPVLSGAGVSHLLLAPATSSAPELGSVRPPNRIARRLGATRAVSGTGERRPPAQRALRLGPSSAAAREAACAAEEPPSPPHLAADDAASSVKVCRALNSCVRLHFLGRLSVQV